MRTRSRNLEEIGEMVGVKKRTTREFWQKFCTAVFATLILSFVANPLLSNELKAEAGKFTKEVIADLVKVVNDVDPLVDEAGKYDARAEAYVTKQADQLGRLFRLEARMNDIDAQIAVLTSKCTQNREAISKACKEMADIRGMQCSFDEKKEKLKSCMQTCQRQCVASRGGCGGGRWLRFLFIALLIVLFVMVIISISGGGGAALMSVPFFGIPKDDRWEVGNDPIQRFRFKMRG